MDNIALFNAIREGDLAVVKPFFEANPESIDIRNLLAIDSDTSAWNELTPLHTAAKYGHLDLVKWLIEHGAEVYSNPMATYPAVIIAAWGKQKAVVDYFLNEIPDKANGTMGLGVTCNLAGREGWIDIVRQHIERDPLAVHQRGWIGDTPLHWPSHNGYIEIVRLLLDAGADPNAHEINWIGGTPLHWASERHSDIIRLLLERGADVNALVAKAGSHHLGATPLIWCAKQDDDSGDAARTLLELGADPRITDAEGKTAEDHARDGNRRRILAVLKE